MSLIIALGCAALVVIALPLTLFRPHWVFYLFLASALFGNILGGYVYDAGNLGMPRAWQPADILAWLTLVAALGYRRDAAIPPDLITKCLRLLAVFAAISLGLGLVLSSASALTASRGLHFIAAGLFAGRYLVNADRVRSLFRFVVAALTLMFVLHLLLRFGLYVPPVAKDYTAFGQMAGERGELSLVPTAYLALLVMGLARMASGAGSRSAALPWLAVAVIGIAITETRALYAATVAVGLVSLFLLKGRIQMVIAMGLGGLALLAFADLAGFDVTSRFRSRWGKGEIAMPQGLDEWRAQEYTSIVQSYQSEPWFLLTGRPIGSTHVISWQIPSVNYYHSEYLGWFDRFGLLGLATFLTLLGRSLLIGFRLSRTSAPALREHGAVVFLLMVGLAVHGLTNPNFMHPRGSPLFICFVMLAANSRAIAESVYGISLQDIIGPSGAALGREAQALPAMSVSDAARRLGHA